MRTVRYSVAMSLDGYIATPDGGYDWIPEEPTIDWQAFMSRFDTAILGRKTYEVTVGQGEASPTTGLRTLVVSSRLDPAEHPDVEIVASDPAAAVDRLRREDGKGIWLLGGGVLFRSLYEAGQVDRVEVALVPVLLGRGIPLLPPSARTARLELLERHEYPSGIVLLDYRVVDA